MTAETFRFRLGDFSCLVFADRNRIIEEKDIIRIFPNDAGKLVLFDFRRLSTPLGFGTNILLVETAGKRILIDTGHGQDNPDDPGHLLANLHAENIPPDSIDTIIITHYHLDHIGGLLDAEGDPVFTKARVVVPKLEHEFWMEEAALATLDPIVAQVLRQTFAVYASRLTLLDGTVEIEPGIRYIPAPGHTPGHCMVSIESQGARLLHIADAIHMPLQLRILRASPKYDHQPHTAIFTRQQLIKCVMLENPLVLAFHFPFPGVGHISNGNWIPFTDL